jgi:multidrug efflux system membrane fusion protein
MNNTSIEGVLSMKRRKRLIVIAAVASAALIAVNVHTARLQLEFTRVTAPFAGRVGLRQVDSGNMIHAADTNGLVLTQIPGVDNQIDTTTGTIKLKDEFANTGDVLFPSEFVNARLKVQTL